MASPVSGQLPVWYYLIVRSASLSIFAILRLHDSRLGRAWMAIREDEVAASAWASTW